MSRFSSLAFRALCCQAVLTSAALAQVPNSLFTVAPIMGHSTSTAPFVSNLQPSLLDNAYNPIGVTPNTSTSVLAGDLITPLGGANYRLTLTVQILGGNLIPAGYPLGGVPTDRFGLALGHPLGSNGYPVEVGGHEALFVSAMDFYVYDVNNNPMLGPIDVRSVANLSHEPTGGGWDGNLLFLIAQSHLTGGVSKMELVIDYRVGQPNDFITWNFSGCSPVASSNPTFLELGSAAVAGRSMTIGARNVPYPTFGVWLVVGDTQQNQTSLAPFGANPACMSWLTTQLGSMPMPVDQTGPFDNFATIAIPPGPGLVGAELGLQAVGFYLNPTFPYNGIYVSDYAEVTIGG